MFKLEIMLSICLLRLLVLELMNVNIIFRWERMNFSWLWMITSDTNRQKILSLVKSWYWSSWGLSVLYLCFWVWVQCFWQFSALLMKKTFLSWPMLCCIQDCVCVDSQCTLSRVIWVNGLKIKIDDCWVIIDDLSSWCINCCSEPFR